MPPVSTTLVKLTAKFAPGVVDTSGKFATGVVDTSDNFAACVVDMGGKFAIDVSSLGRYVFGSEISYNKPPPRLPGLAC